jgi:hypothetical protein
MPYRFAAKQWIFLLAPYWYLLPLPRDRRLSQTTAKYLRLVVSSWAVTVRG